jgi:hypothetical protein
MFKTERRRSRSHGNEGVAVGLANHLSELLTRPSLGYALLHITIILLSQQAQGVKSRTPATLTPGHAHAHAYAR